ncbi:hypothetical protein BDQ17DRAFT_1346066 [Cyathus striatus]|nr:hypothetical protein BDQ17DRAFT_1346066 [Cyathus striatus]
MHKVFTTSDCCVSEIHYGEQIMRVGSALEGRIVCSRMVLHWIELARPVEHIVLALSLSLLVFFTVGQMVLATVPISCVEQIAATMSSTMVILLHLHWTLAVLCSSD